MKYPFVVFYRDNRYEFIDKFLIENKNRLECSIFITSDPKDLNNLYNANYQVLLTFGNTKEEYDDILSTQISQHMNIRHIHLSQIKTVEELNGIINIKLTQICASERSLVRPIFSIFTTTYNTNDKIFRAYNSLLNQTLKDWEWVIIDDSPNDDNFNFLRKNICNDNRIRLYRRNENNGSIGNVKNEAISLCRGKYVLELDHDDEILPFVLQETTDYFDNNSDVGFIYMDFINIYENGNNYHYGDFICKGYGAYYTQKYNGEWRYVYLTPNINNITLSHLVCCPNHPRIWRRDVLINIGSYCEYLPICDDYEILLRTALNTKMAKINKLGYIQYMNDSNNNFSLIRNAEINRIGPKYISPNYYSIFNVNEKMKELGAYEDEKYIYEHTQIWKHDPETYTHNYCNLVVNNDYDCQYCIVGLDSLFYNIDKIKELYANPRNDFLLLDNKSNVRYLWQKLEQFGLDRIKCYSLIDVDNNKLINYFKLMYKSMENYQIINVDIKKPNFNTDYANRYEVINSNTSNNDAYLEIGVEYGETIKNTHFLNKTGVDPDPKCNLNYIIKKTSDDYFNSLKTVDAIDDNSSVDSDDNIESVPIVSNKEQFDAIFIDGMHQVEYLINDVNNSIRHLNEGGAIFLDDILPSNQNEQRKVPLKHYYENGILKYGEPWTGDVWKLVYHMLLKYNNYITKFKYYHHANYRGVALIKIKEQFEIEPSEIEEINSYEYFKDFDSYIDLLTSYSKS